MNLFWNKYQDDNNDKVISIEEAEAVSSRCSDNDARKIEVRLFNVPLNKIY
jgi:hypothetical protein